jgi:DNA repair protein RecO (recombination protein O)
MPKSRTYQTEAIIIKKTKLGEADRILTFYTPDMGKIQGVAKGVRRPKSRLSGHLELLTHSMVSLAHGRNLDTVIGSQTIDSFLLLKSDLDLAACALYATELVDQFAAERQENRPLFVLFLEMMHELSKNNNHGMMLRYFELHLLHEVGYRPQLQQCVACRRPLQLAATYFSAAAGGVLCPDCRWRQSFTYPLSVGALKALRLLQDGDWTAPGQIQCDAGIRREMETVLRHYLRYLLERDIRSAAWLDTLKMTSAYGNAP